MPGCSRSDRPSSGSDSTTPTSSTTAPCSACSVTVSPKPLKICGAGSTARLTATGSPSGGTFSWSSSDTSIATVSGSGNTATVTVVAAGTVTITVTYSPSGCGPCNDTVSVKTCTCTPGRKYAHADKSVANLIAIKTRIKTRYAKLCCEDEGCSTVAAFHAAYANISNSSSGLKWAQVGVSRRRNAGSTAVIQYRKAEIQGDLYRINMDTANAPAEGSVHEYKCELDKSTGTWTYYYDGTAWQTYTDNFWTTHLGTVAQWVGEIYNKEDGMPGTDGNKCNFTECQYKVDGGAYQDANWPASNITTDDASEWGVERVSASAINIWDKKPT
jgi:hypothetical protein